MTQRLSIITVGGGASGVLLATHLLRDPAMDLRVTLVESATISAVASPTRPASRSTC